MSMTDERRMALAGIGPIRMRLNETQGDFESCDNGWANGQALCGFDLDLFFAVSEATIIEVIPKHRPGKNRVKITRAVGNGWLRIDGELWNLYIRTTRVANHWIHSGFSYVQIEIVE